VGLDLLDVEEVGHLVFLLLEELLSGPQTVALLVDELTENLFNATLLSGLLAKSE